MYFMTFGQKTNYVRLMKKEVVFFVFIIYRIERTHHWFRQDDIRTSYVRQCTNFTGDGTAEKRISENYNRIIILKNQRWVSTAENAIRVSDIYERRS